MVLTAHSKHAQQALVTFCRPTKEWADFIYGERLTDRDRDNFSLHQTESPEVIQQEFIQLTYRNEGENKQVTYLFFVLFFVVVVFVVVFTPSQPGR